MLLESHGSGNLVNDAHLVALAIENGAALCSFDRDFRRFPTCGSSFPNRLQSEQMMKRYGAVLRVKAESIDEYRAYHEAVWPEVLGTIRSCNIRNYSIYLRDGLLFACYEYHGTDHKADMEKMAADQKTQEWWRIMMPMQEPVASAAEGEWWAPMEEVFHVD